MNKGDTLVMVIWLLVALLPYAFEASVGWSEGGW